MCFQTGSRIAGVPDSRLRPLLRENKVESLFTSTTSRRARSKKYSLNIPAELSRWLFKTENTGC